MSGPHTYLVILAGGSGSRLWPLSRSHKPKQLLALAGERSLLQSTFDRNVPLVPAERVIVMTEQSHADGIREQLPEVPPENIIVEPARRGTAGSLGLAAAAIAERDPNAVMASVHSDAHIGDAEEFRRTLSAAFAAAEKTRQLVLMGIEPTGPSTQLGYIEAAGQQDEIDGYAVRKVARFVEKPDLERAMQFVKSGRHYWNPGVFVWRVDAILAELQRLQPRIDDLVRHIAARLSQPDGAEVLARVYPTVPIETIDVGVLEQSDIVSVIPARFPWSDIGSWSEIFDVLPHDADGNVVQGEHLGLGTRDTLVYGTSRKIATIGLTDMVVVETNDVILVCPRDRAADVKKLVERLQLDPSKADLL
ncbi:MAG: mannose-1-phosphate guanylyltransferase [Chloroflexi bacterium]|nr:mannose-1-phosphate guanylyltransferase [Chloroflexota bacterium]